MLLYKQLHKVPLDSNNNHTVVMIRPLITQCFIVHGPIMEIKTLSPQKGWAYRRGGPNVEVHVIINIPRTKGGKTIIAIHVQSHVQSHCISF